MSALEFGSVMQNPMLKPRRRRDQAVRRSWALRSLVAREHAGWADKAPCKGKTELFHGGNNDRLKVARAVCDLCPVRADCLAFCWAVEQQIDPKLWQGVYGGLTANERRLWLTAELQATRRFDASNVLAASHPCGRLVAQKSEPAPAETGPARDQALGGAR